MEPGKNTEMLVVIGPEDLGAYKSILHNVSQINLFPLVLQEDKYTCINSETYEKAPDHLIKILYHDNKWEYKNLRNPRDRGSLIDFIANRLHTEEVQIAKQPADVMTAARIAQSYYSEHIKNLQDAYKLTQKETKNSNKLKHGR
ncbi:MAG: hypothetical protein E6Q24_04725 [Chitinophagaceae bacterium]|nr:MAG: hypothetical protein E6Q24_04725 [Chitinophagaceae bacterium]